MKLRGYDQKCHDLACHFLQGEDMTETVRNIAAAYMAQQIQDLIESFLECDLLEVKAKAGE